ncbi:MAG: hypothetical protein Q8O56_04015 [Solirubrobacteraceae bacterium]|nr:hypothetical protein [Solirubrobacteraceae bacterium]
MQELAQRIRLASPDAEAHAAARAKNIQVRLDDLERVRADRSEIQAAEAALSPEDIAKVRRHAKLVWMKWAAASLVALVVAVAIFGNDDEDGGERAAVTETVTVTAPTAATTLLLLLLLLRQAQPQLHRRRRRHLRPQSPKAPQANLPNSFRRYFDEFKNTDWGLSVNNISGSDSGWIDVMLAGSSKTPEVMDHAERVCQTINFWLAQTDKKWARMGYVELFDGTRLATCEIGSVSLE